MQNEEGKNMDLYIPRKCSACVCSLDSSPPLLFVNLSVLRVMLIALLIGYDRKRKSELRQ